MSLQSIQTTSPYKSQCDSHNSNTESQTFNRENTSKESQSVTTSHEATTLAGTSSGKAIAHVPETQLSSNKSSTEPNLVSSDVFISDTLPSDINNSLVTCEVDDHEGLDEEENEDADNERYLVQLAAIFRRRKKSNNVLKSQDSGEELSSREIIELNAERENEASQLQIGAYNRASQFSEILSTQMKSFTIDDNDKETSEEDIEVEKLILPDSFVRMLRSSSREDFIARRLRREEFLALKFETLDKTFGKIQYDHFKVPSNIDLCGSCFLEFDMDDRKEITAVCGHKVCRRCLEKSSEEPCANCELFTEYRNEPLPLVVVDEIETRWLFKDIQDSRRLFQNKYWFDEKVLLMLKSKFKLDSFRPCQREIINALMQSKNVFVLMASGGGKSLTYQLPALLCGSFYLVISPIVSLMNDQIRHLKQLGISAVALDNANYDATLSDLRKQSPINKIVYVSPERLLNDKVREDFHILASKGHVARVIFDEAHCIYQWGIDFRHSYLYMDQILSKVFKGVPVALYSASITPSQRQEILRILDMDNPERFKFFYFLSSFDRPNLHYRIEKIPKSEKNKYERVLQICKSWQFRNSSGLVYCNTRNECDRLAEYLLKNEVTATSYHANIAEDKKLKYQEKWMTNDIRVMVCTVAFGLGINKPDVRFVIHYSMPKNLEGYFQETGRAGRDRKYAACFLLSSVNDRIYWENMIETCFEKQKTEAKKNNNKYFEAIAKNNREIQLKGLNEILDFVELKLPRCHREFLLHHFGQLYNQKRCEYNLSTACDLCRKTRFNRAEVGLVKRINDKYKRAHPEEFYEYELRDIPDDLSD